MIDIKTIKFLDNNIDISIQHANGALGLHFLCFSIHIFTDRIKRNFFIRWPKRHGKSYPNWLSYDRK